MITTKGFRCPNCAQAQEMMMTNGDEQYTMNKEMTEMYYEGKQLVEPFQCIASEPMTCRACDETSDFENWVTAFNDPLAFFEMEQLCHCGGELWMDQIPGTRDYGFVCEKCEWVKPHKRVSGA